MAGASRSSRFRVSLEEVKGSPNAEYAGKTAQFTTPWPKLGIHGVIADPSLPEWKSPTSLLTGPNDFKQP